MALKAVLTTDEFDELDEGVQALYEVKDEISILMIDGIDDHPTIKGLKNGHANSKRERDEAKKKVKILEKRFGPIAKVDADVNFDSLDDEAILKVIGFAKGEIVLVEPTDPNDPEGKLKLPDAPDLEKVRDLARKPIQRDLEEMTVDRDKYKGQLEGTIINQDLTEALIAEKIMPVYMGPLKSHFSKNVKLVESGGDLPTAMMEGEAGEEPIGAFIKAWAQSEEGKAYVDAGGNSGGGNNGGNRGNKHEPKFKNPWDKTTDDGANWNVTKQMALYKEDPTKAIKLAAEHNITIE